MAPSKGRPEELERRDFLKLGATGVAASLAGCATGSQAPSAGMAPVPDADEAPAVSPSSEAQQTPQLGDLPDPATAEVETWLEPWVWRPADWPGGRLELNLVRNQNPGNAPSTGNPAPPLFSWNGTSPGPTIRVRGDGVIRTKVRNTLGLDVFDTAVGPFPDPGELPPALMRDTCLAATGEEPPPPEPGAGPPCNLFGLREEMARFLGAKTRPGWSLKGHVNGVHATHVTNIHTHGLHVAPGANPDGTHSDNVLLRILPRADWEARRQSDDPELHQLAQLEHVGELDYEYRLAATRDGARRPHPPGTHWYHPHAHGSTADQTASGVAGFLIVEGDVDESVNQALAGETWPDPEEKSGPFDYRERLIMMQRVNVGSVDQDARRGRRDLRLPPLLAVNGEKTPPILFMRPGAVERWRVLNASSDGSGTLRFVVLRGYFVQRDQRLWRVTREEPAEEGAEPVRRLEAVSAQDIEDAKLDLHQLSFDGLTLVVEEGGRARHTVLDLSRRNAGTTSPFHRPPQPGESVHESRLRAFQACYTDGDAIRRTYVRPNEVLLANANRTDVFFRAPLDAAGEVLTIVGLEPQLQSDNFPRQQQRMIDDPDVVPRRPFFDVVVAWVHVRGDAVPGGVFDVSSLAGRLPEVPPLLRPVAESELRIPRNEAAARRLPAGAARTRVIAYSGTGPTDFPSHVVPEAYAAAHPELEGLTWARHRDVPVLLPMFNGTMAINTEFDLAANPEPGPPRRFRPDDPQRSRVLVDTAEEWVLYSCSQTVWSHTDRRRYPQPGSYGAHFVSYPVAMAEGWRRFWADHEFRITSKGADHPFHIHINPMWVLRVDVPDENGELHNVLPEPRWMDTVPIPRNGGRVVFRTRFDDFVGTWVHHCHILLHEDLGMMQAVECSDSPEEANYRPRERVASHAMDASDVDAIYPKPSRALMYRQNLSFVDPNEIGGQAYPGFQLEIPELED